MLLLSEAGHLTGLGELLAIGALFILLVIVAVYVAIIAATVLVLKRLLQSRSRGVQIAAWLLTAATFTVPVLFGMIFLRELVNG
ncbi:MAG TPA: hypothetical protein VFV87_06650 [Pirellulaceae bacterium]|nr:hypothetical protein [Pirellulaceae bacterium]